MRFLTGFNWFQASRNMSLMYSLLSVALVVCSSAVYAGKIVSDTSGPVAGVQYGFGGLNFDNIEVDMDPNNTGIGGTFNTAKGAVLVLSRELSLFHIFSQPGTY